MTDSSASVDAAIQKVIEDFQTKADQEKVMAPKRIAAQEEIDQLIDDLVGIGEYDETKVTPDMVAAFLVFQNQVMVKLQQGDMAAQMQMAKFGEDFLQGLQAHVNEMQNDQQTIMEVQQKMQELSVVMRPPAVRQDMPTFHMAVTEPEGDHGDWSVTLVPLVVDKDFNVSMADKLDFDLYVTGEVTPQDSLSSAFNSFTASYKAGEKFEPMTFSAKTTENGAEKIMHMRGHVYKGGQYLQQLPFPSQALAKRGPAQGMDMNALMNLLGGGGDPGPNGPN